MNKVIWTLLFSPAGLCQHHSWSWRNYGPLRLSVPHGHLRQRLHRQLHQVRLSVLRCRGRGFRTMSSSGIENLKTIITWCYYGVISAHVTRSSPSLHRGPNPTKVIQQLLALRPDQQLYIYNSLKSHLTERGLLGALEEAA